MLSPFEVFILMLVVVIVVMLFRNRRSHELADQLARRYCGRNEFQFLDGTVLMQRMSIHFAPPRLCRHYRFDYSLNSVDRYQGVLSLCGDHVQSFRVNPDHLSAQMNVEAAVGTEATSTPAIPPKEL